MGSQVSCLLRSGARAAHRSQRARWRHGRAGRQAGGQAGRRGRQAGWCRQSWHRSTPHIALLLLPPPCARRVAKAYNPHMPLRRHRAAPAATAAPQDGLAPPAAHRVHRACLGDGRRLQGPQPGGGADGGRHGGGALPRQRLSARQHGGARERGACVRPAAVPQRSGGGQGKRAAGRRLSEVVLTLACSELHASCGARLRVN